MRVLLALSVCLCFAILVATAEECDYTMKKMCDLVSNATYRERGCWFNCRIKAEFEVFEGTKLDGTQCKSIVGNTDGVCRNGLCWPNE